MDINGYLKNIGRFILRSAEDYSQKNRTPVHQTMVQKPMIEDETTEKPKPKSESKREKPPLIRTDKEFVKLFKQLTYRHNAWEAWSDFVTMFACSISNPLDKTHYDEREKFNGYTFCRTQLALFDVAPQFINIGTYYWLRDVVSSEGFAFVTFNGVAYWDDANTGRGVRPVFAIG